MGQTFILRPVTLKERIIALDIVVRDLEHLRKGGQNNTSEIILNTRLAKFFITTRRIFSQVLIIFLLWASPSAMAAPRGGWQFDSLTSSSASPTSDGQQVYEVLLKMLDRWNAHDIEGHLEAYWKSPELLVVVDSEQFNGWQQLHDSYVNGYPDRNSMGYINPARVQVKLLKPDLALALTWWTISFPNSKQKVVGNTTMNLQKFDDGWKIVASHSSTAEM
jgi:uncharacterized protein (TIGR02246 family)